MVAFSPMSEFLSCNRLAIGTLFFFLLSVFLISISMCEFLQFFFVWFNFQSYPLHFTLIQVFQDLWWIAESWLWRNFHLFKTGFEYVIQLFDKMPNRDMTSVLMGFHCLVGFQMGLQLLENNVHGRVYVCLIVSYKLIEITNCIRKLFHIN